MRTTMRKISNTRNGPQDKRYIPTSTTDTQTVYNTTANDQKKTIHVQTTDSTWKYKRAVMTSQDEAK